MRGGVTQLMAVELINVHLVICKKKASIHMAMLQLKGFTRQEHNYTVLRLLLSETPKRSIL